MESALRQKPRWFSQATCWVLAWGSQRGPETWARLPATPVQGASPFGTLTAPGTPATPAASVFMVATAGSQSQPSAQLSHLLHPCNVTHSFLNTPATSTGNFEKYCSKYQINPFPLIVHRVKAGKELDLPFIKEDSFCPPLITDLGLAPCFY